MRSLSALSVLFLLLFALPASPATVLVLRFHNASQNADLNWVGESVSEVLRTELSASSAIVLDRETRAEAMKRLSLRPDADFTKATLIRLGQSVDADYVLYGTYETKPGAANAVNGKLDVRDSSLDIVARSIDLHKLHDGPEVSEAGKLSDLARLEEHLAWEEVKYIDPHSDAQLDKFLAPQKLIRADAQESYVRGLLSANSEQRQKWFTQASTLDTKYVSPAFEMGRLLLERKDYRSSLTWFQRVPVSDERYPEARFRMGLAAYGALDFAAAANYFREVAKIYPLNEVYNNLGASEAALNQPGAIDDYRRALEGDPNDAVYQFNLGVALLKKNSFDEAAKRLDAAVGHDANDDEASSLLAQAQDKVAVDPKSKSLAAPRLKQNFDATAFRQLKAMLSPKGGG